MGEGDCRVKVCHREGWSFEKSLETFIVQTWVPKMSVTAGSSSDGPPAPHTCALQFVESIFPTKQALNELTQEVDYSSRTQAELVRLRCFILSFPTPVEGP